MWVWLCVGVSVCGGGPTEDDGCLKDGVTDHWELPAVGAGNSVVLPLLLRNSSKKYHQSGLSGPSILVDVLESQEQPR